MPALIQSVTRALTILDTLAQHPNGLSVREIAEKVELNVSTTHHLVSTLEAQNYIFRLANSTYGLGPAVPRLYNAYLHTHRVDERLQAALNALVKRTRETTYLVTWQNGDILIQAIVEGSQPLRVGGLQVGFSGYSHARAGGKALLAYLSEQELDDYLAVHPMKRLTPNTLHTREGLKTHLKAVVKQGYALDKEEFTEGVGCVAAPIFSADGKAVAALSVSAPAGRLNENQADLIEAVTQASREASALLGFNSTTHPAKIVPTTRQRAHRPKS